MNCQEVMELMQRQLDDDLDESEKTVLMNHTGQCPDCAAMFERLQLLSAELTSLPKVMPRYSLVDAIMPQLERIELFSQPESETEPSSAVEMAEPASLRAKRERRWPSIRIMSGVIAAGIVAGLFLVTYKPGMSPGFSGAAQFAANDAANSGAADMANETRQELSFTAKIPENIDAPKIGTEALKKQDSAEEPSSNANKAESEEKAMPTSGNSDASTGNDAPAAEQSDSIDKSLNDGDGSNSSEGFTGKEDKNGYGIAADHSALIAPNGKYSAQAEDFTLKIYAVSDQSLVFTSPRKNGKLMNLNWSEDSAQLTYEVHLEQGAIVKYVIDLASLTEKKADH
ncbi:anti-sigma factor family protein [Paenibacillus sp. Soil522]|uniref:anti-sigma factor family protein n=1 Tax=Paenibacillus sp. Soil522 TaxID=1736388 RepID=UPI0006F46883|nr:zf-HC2 domain-containing protein [Paenibacillus sp. Soil522]KRE54193.1 hypothetical protein ASG81_00305 [Paenibacillus sp. Soil522]